MFGAGTIDPLKIAVRSVLWWFFHTFFFGSSCLNLSGCHNEWSHLQMHFRIISKFIFWFLKFETRGSEKEATIIFKTSWKWKYLKSCLTGKYTYLISYLGKCNKCYVWVAELLQIFIKTSMWWKIILKRVVRFKPSFSAPDSNSNFYC